MTAIPQRHRRPPEEVLELAGFERLCAAVDEPESAIAERHVCVPAGPASAGSVAALPAAGRARRNGRGAHLVFSTEETTVPLAGWPWTPRWFPEDRYTR